MATDEAGYRRVTGCPATTGALTSKAGHFSQSYPIALRNDLRITYRGLNDRGGRGAALIETIKPLLAPDLNIVQAVYQWSLYAHRCYPDIYPT